MERINTFRPSLMLTFTPSLDQMRGEGQWYSGTTASTSATGCARTGFASSNGSRKPRSFRRWRRPPPPPASIPGRGAGERNGDSRHKFGTVVVFEREWGYGSFVSHRNPLVVLVAGPGFEPGTFGVGWQAQESFLEGILGCQIRFVCPLGALTSSWTAAGFGISVKK